MTHRFIKIFVSIILLLAVAISNGWASPAQAQTITQFFARGRVTDNRGNPIANTEVQVLPAATNGSVFMTNAAGQWQSQHGPTASQVFKTGSQSSVQTQLIQDRSLHIVVSPSANQMANGDFESNLSGWTTGGSGIANIEARGHSGKAARLGAYCPSPCLTENEHFDQDPFRRYKLIVDSQENAHILNDRTGYWLRTASGHWLHPDLPYGIGFEVPFNDAQLGNDDVLHVVYSTPTQVVYTQKAMHENWTNLEILKYTLDARSWGYFVWIDVDILGNVHVVYRSEIVPGSISYNYTRRDVNGNWSAAVTFTETMTEMAAAADGGAYLFFQNTMRRVLPDGTLQNPVSTGCTVKTAESTNLGEVQVLCVGRPNEYRVMNAKGEWRLKQTFYSEPYVHVSAYFSRDGSAIFHTGDRIDEGIDTYWLKQPDANELEYFVHNTIVAPGDGSRSPYVTRYGGLHMVNSGGTSSYVQSQVDLQTTEASLEQTVTVPPLSENPTLSYLYQIQGPAKLQESGFTLTLIDEGGTATNLRTDRAVGLWKHAWADLSRWAGQTVTLRFRYKQAAGEPLSSLLVDEVSLGTWETPVIRAITPDTVVDWPSAPDTITLTGGYFLNGAVVEINGQSIPATVVSHGELTFDLPAGLRPGHYNIRVTNPGGKQSNYIVLRLGLQHFLPFAGG